MAGLRVAPELIAAAAQAGWRTDDPGTDAYDQRAREELEKLQNSLRQKMLQEDRLTQNGSAGGPATA